MFGKLKENGPKFLDQCPFREIKKPTSPLQSTFSIIFLLNTE